MKKLWGGIIEHVSVLRSNIVDPLSIHVPERSRVLGFTRIDDDWKTTAGCNLRICRIPGTRKLRQIHLAAPLDRAQESMWRSQELHVGCHPCPPRGVARGN